MPFSRGRVRPEQLWFRLARASPSRSLALRNLPLPVVLKMPMDVKWVRLELDLMGYHPPPSDPDLAATAVRLATMADLGDNDESRYRLFELNRECSALRSRGSIRKPSASPSMARIGLAWQRSPLTPIRPTAGIFSAR